MKNIKAVILDLDNTIGNRNIYSYKLIKEIIKNNVKDIEKDPLLFETMAQDLYTFDESGNAKKNDTFRRFNEKYKTNIGKDYDIGKYWSENLAKYCIPFDDAIETLEYLKTKYKLGIITNGLGHEQREKIKNAKIDKYFDAIIISDEVKCAKPDKQIYEIALKQLNVDASEAVFVGDTFSLDIKGAIDSGLEAIWFKQDSYRPCDYAIKTINKLSNLKRHL